MGWLSPKSKRRLRAAIWLTAILVLLKPSYSSAQSDTFQIDGAQPNVWPGVVSFAAPCGVQITTANDPGTWNPPPRLDGMIQNNPSDLCANMVDTLTDPTTLKPTFIGAVNPRYTGLPDGTPLPVTTSLLGGGVNQPQDPQNAPTPIIETSLSGTMEFMLPWHFMDETDTRFEGKTEGALEIPYDDRMCPNQSAVLDPSTGLPKIASIPPLCQITTPEQYLNALKQGHMIKWAEYSAASVTAYGPMDTTIPSDAQPFQRQAKGGYTQGMLAIPYETDNNSTVVRLAIRYEIGFDGQMPLTWGGWPEPYCVRSSCLRPTHWAGMQTAWLYSQPITVQIKPVGYVQFHYLPTMVFYQPPGNISASQISVTNTYTQSYQLDQTSTITDQVEYDQKTKEDDSISPGFSYNGVGGNYTIYTTNAEWDEAAKSATGENYALHVSDAVTLGVTKGQMSPKLSNTAPDVAHLTFETEPFWLDQIVVAMHSQFAVWEYPEGTVLQPLGATDLHTFYVQELANCLPKPLNLMDTGGIDVAIDIQNPDNTTTHEKERLSWSDCAKLLALDPFYKALSQAAPPPIGIPVSGTVSMTTGLTPFKSTMMTSFSTTSNFSSTTKATITATKQATFGGPSFSGSTWLYKLGASRNTTTSSSTTDEVDVVLGSTQSTQTQETFTSEMDVGDCPRINGAINCGAPPGNSPNVQIFMDKRFGTMMGVLPDLNIPPPQPRLNENVAVKYRGSLLTLNHLALPHNEQLVSETSAANRKITVTAVAPPPHPKAPPAPLRLAGPGQATALPPNWVGHVFPADTPRQ